MPLAAVQHGSGSRKSFPEVGRRVAIDGLLQWKAKKATTMLSRITHAYCVAMHRVRGGKVRGKDDEYNWRPERCAKSIVIVQGDDGLRYAFGEEPCEWCRKRDEEGHWERIRSPMATNAALMMILGERPFEGGPITKRMDLEVYAYNPKRQHSLDEAIGQSDPIKVTLKFSLGKGEDDVTYQKYEVHRALPEEEIQPTESLMQRFVEHVKKRSLERFCEPPSYEETKKAVAAYFQPAAIQSDLSSGGDDVGTQETSGGMRVQVPSSGVSTGTPPAEDPGEASISEDRLDQLLKEANLKSSK